eukprot:evm.model.scf_3962.1 EVM.evm.TU.scf_3962.1   scf_3962:4335-5785(-)
MAVGVDVNTQVRRQKGVTFAHGPYKNFPDGHPPEKETERERRLYRKGLTLARYGRPIVVVRCPPADWSASWLETRQAPSADAAGPNTVAAPVSLPATWESFECRPQAKGVPALGLGPLDAVPLGGETPRLLCRDSVTSIDVPMPPKAALAAVGTEGEPAKEAGAPGYEELDAEALWSRESGSWEAGNVIKAEGLGVEGAGGEPARQSGCWAGVLGALGWSEWDTAAPVAKGSPVALERRVPLDGCWTRWVKSASV